MRKLPFLCALAILIAPSLYAQNNRFEDWRKADLNGDGVLTLEEVPAPLQVFFDRIDSNADGKLGEQELIAANKRLQQRSEGSRNKRPVQLPEGVSMRRDEVYREGHDRWKLDVYLPEAEAPQGGRPGLVFVHGGGWRSGSKDGGQWSSL
ncbi:MAG: hypothetical protein P1U58_20845, partial [Verrucomicrobiales bacterium]|nr:hypothetical protein [Verrucomicrobiales bacterium]